MNIYYFWSIQDSAKTFFGQRFFRPKNIFFSQKMSWKYFLRSVRKIVKCNYIVMSRKILGGLTHYNALRLREIMTNGYNFEIFKKWRLQGTKMLEAFLIDAERAVNRQPGDRPGTLRADTIFNKNMIIKKMFSYE